LFALQIAFDDQGNARPFLPGRISRLSNRFHERFSAIGRNPRFRNFQTLLINTSKRTEITFMR